MGANKVPQPVQVEMAQAWQLGGCAPRTAGGLERTPHHALRLGLWWEARTARRGRAIVQISKPSPGASWCPPPCPELPPRGWQMLFHRLRRVGGLRKVLLGGSGGQWGCRQLPPSQSWLTVASQVPQCPRLGGRGWCFGIETGPPCLCSPPPLRPPPHCPPSFLALAPSHPWLRLQSPPGKAGEEAQRAQNSGCPCSQVFARAVRDRQACGEFGACGAGGSSRVGRQAGGREGGAVSPAC